MTSRHLQTSFIFGWRAPFSFLSPMWEEWVPSLDLACLLEWPGMHLKHCYNNEKETNHPPSIAFNKWDVSFGYPLSCEAVTMNIIHMFKINSVQCITAGHTILLHCLSEAVIRAYSISSKDGAKGSEWNLTTRCIHWCHFERTYSTVAKQQILIRAHDK